jgi:hypothetical protein
MDLNYKSLMRRSLPYLVGIIAFVLITVIYFSPMFEGKSIRASDTVQFMGMSKEIADYREKTGEEALWANNMFSGMPAVQISMQYSKNLIRYVEKIVRLGFETPARQVFMYFLGFFILLVVLGVNPWLSIAGAIAFAFSSYFFIILEAGHNSKATAIGFMAPVLAGVILSYRGRLLAGGLLTALFLSLEILSNHPQITYYLALMVLGYGIIEFIGHYRRKQLPAFFRASAVLLIAALLAVLTNAANLWGTYEYSKYSIRGQSELTHDQENRTTGLDKDYATSWSYGKLETFNLLIPNFYGGSSHGKISKNSETYEVLKQNRVPNADDIIKQMPMYWGPQPFTSGPVYIGAVVIFLFILSLFVLKGPIKWWGITITVLAVLLAWGKNFMWLTDLFLDYFPLYNKFRTVSMILVMAELTIPLLAFLGLQKIFEKELDKKVLLNYGKYTLYITGGILLFFILFAGSLFTFSADSDAATGLPDWLMDALRADRLSMLRSDAIRSLVFILLAAALLWAYVSGKLSKKDILVFLPVLFLADMWPVAKRYLDKDDFEKKSKVERPYSATAADQAILKDKTLYYRVYNMTEALDKSARTSYFHKNIGGYHGAKLRRYQEMIDFPISSDRSRLVSVLSNQPTFESITRAFEDLPALNMLNTRYVIYNNDSEPLLNPNALGNAWFVSDVQMVNNADEEIATIEDLQPDSIAVADKRFESYFTSHPYRNSREGSITLTKYDPKQLTYEYESPADQFAVFSEIYYEKGWKAFVNGKEVPHIRVNYVLRGMVLPGGSHTVEFRFEPKSYYAGQNISLVSSLTILLLIAGYFFLILKGWTGNNKP